MDIQIRLIRIAELEHFVASDQYRQMLVLPISPRRARSQALNPRAQPEDVALALAYSGNELVGYMGALPEMLQIGNSKPLRAAWLSCLWVSPAARGQGLAKRLTRILMDEYDHRVLLSGFTPEAGNLYRRLGLFEEMRAGDGLRGYLRPNLADLLPPKGRWWQRMLPVLRLIDGFLARPNTLRLGFHSTVLPCRIRYVEHLDGEMADFVTERRAEGIVQSSVVVLNWWLGHPWVVQSAVADEVAELYHFTSMARQFSTQALQLMDEQGKTCGVLVLTLRDGHLRVPFAFFDDKQTGTIAQVIFAYALQSGAKMLTLFCPRLTAHCRQNRTPFFALRDLKRTFFVGKPLADHPLDMQDGEGDLGFT